MSSSPAVPSHRRQVSNVSVSSLASAYTSSASSYFPDSRSTTVTSTSSKSSRFSWAADKQQQQQQQEQERQPHSPARIPPSLNSFHSTGNVMERSHHHTPPPLRQSFSEIQPRPESPSTDLVRPGSANRRPLSTASISTGDISSLRNSSVSHFRTLSTISSKGPQEFGIPASQDVAGMHGRKRLTKAPTDQQTSWERMNWMDKRRQYIQAYEYLCHIGEAKEWIEEAISEPIPPIVELEEAMRDGVTLAKLVRVFAPDLVPRIFEDPKLQFRHTDNISRFFRFVKRVDLPEVFHFELTDLYNKKNIPKVIYCIHALAFLLLRLGMTQKGIGNLVGKLEFTEDEIRDTQRGLDIAGVNLPQFRGVGGHFGEPEPEPEPVESEEERIERELHENIQSIEEVQRIIRGALLRMRLGDLMGVLWDEEPKIIELQAAVRGMFARSSFDYRREMHNWATEVQSAARGYLARRQVREKARGFGTQKSTILSLQARARGRLARQGLATQKAVLVKEGRAITKLQAAARAFLLRQSLGDRMACVYDSEPVVVELQGIARGFLARRKLAQSAKQLESSQDVWETLQARARGFIVRREYATTIKSLKACDGEKVNVLQGAVRGFLLRQEYDAKVEQLHGATETWIQLQAAARAFTARKEYKQKHKTLQDSATTFTKFQAAIRGAMVRTFVHGLNDALDECVEEITEMQAMGRAVICRLKVRATLTALDASTEEIVDLQSHSRGFLFRKHHRAFLDSLHDCTPEITYVQAHFRGAKLRGAVADLLAALQDEEEFIIEFQGHCRGFIQRKRFRDKLDFFKKNMEKVVKIQSYVRAKQQGEAYRSLTSGKNPPVGTIKNFVHLLNDSDFDFDEEIEFERLRKNVIQHVRANEMAEQYIDQLDIKIALLVKNKITLDEVIKHQKRFTGHVGNLLSNVDLGSSDPFDLKALNKNSRRKLELYQTLFFALQTQPIYLARLFQRIREQAMPDREVKRIENLVMGLFGYAQKRREEYYLLKLIARSIKEEIEKCDTPQDYLKSNFFWVKLMMNYIRSPRDRKFMRDLLGSLVRERIVENDELDLESDPMQIYRSSVNNEELRTGRRSARKQNIPREEAIRDPETRETFIIHLQDLRDLSDYFIDSLEDNINRMPYGVRFLAQQSIQALSARFPDESPQAIVQVVEHFIYQKYINPAIMTPDAFGLADKNLSAMHKKNLGELSKILTQISAGKLFTHENVYLQPLNEYVSAAIHRLHGIFQEIANVPDAETHFEMDEYDDLTSTSKPTLYIKLADIFALHQLVAQECEVMAPTREDQLRDIMRELGSVKASEEQLASVSKGELTLQLNPRIQQVDDTDSEIKALFVETKRCILYIVRIQTGANLMEILVKPIHMEDEEKWQQLIAEEQSGRRRGAYSDSHALSDVSSMTYAELKRTALENVINLERTGKITRKNHYQDLLNAIATDIRTKHRRRIQRAKELDGVKQTLAHLSEKATYLEAQLQSYNDYIEQAMVTLQTKKGKKKSVLPFTRQYFHMRELQRSGKVPKFGSFKYSARALSEKGVLVSLEGYPEKQWDKVNFTISSDEVGIFFLEASYGAIQIPGASAHVPLDDLLQAQFNNHQYMALFEGMIKLNVNLFLHLLFRKFYRDE